jgi:hypothetical protein
MGLLMVICGLGGVLVAVVSAFVPAIRNADTLLPDHDQAAPAARSKS